MRTRPPWPSLKASGFWTYKWTRCIRTQTLLKPGSRMLTMTSTPTVTRRWQVRVNRMRPRSRRKIKARRRLMSKLMMKRMRMRMKKMMRTL